MDEWTLQLTNEINEKKLKKLQKLNKNNLKIQ